MEVEKGIKVVTGKSGKTRYQASVWYGGKFITSMTVDSIALARVFRQRKLEEAIRGELKPASARRAQRKLEEDQDRPMQEWAARYIKANPGKHGENRLFEYDQVGRLLGKRTMRDFSGKEGGKLIRQLADEWRFVRFVRGTRGEPFQTLDRPISDQTLRLRLSALDRLIGFAMEEMPESLNYVGPKKPRDYAPPPAHSNKRSRLPSLDEYAMLLKHFGVNSDMGEFLRVVDETGCRLSEVSKAAGERVKFFCAGGHVLGGVLTLVQHKTAERIGTREVPLSRHAAQVLHARKAIHGEGALFPGLPAPNGICKAFDSACTALGLHDLQIKDFRREFITRNIRAMPALELMSIIGSSSLIDLGALGAAEQRVQGAVGHRSAKTTLGYVTPEQQATAQAFTASSRWPAVVALLNPDEVAPVRLSTESQALERELTDLLARMRSLGLSTAAA